MRIGEGRETRWRRTRRRGRQSDKNIIACCAVDVRFLGDHKTCSPFFSSNVFSEAFPNRTYYCFHHLLFALFLEGATIRARGWGEGREKSLWSAQKERGEALER